MKKSLIKLLIVVAGLAVAGNLYAQEQKKEAEVIATFEYQSNRPEKEYKGKTFKYHILSDGSICQADKPNVKFEKTWLYDWNGNGKIDEEDLAARKSGTLIYMHPKFNEKANAEVRNVLNNLVDLKGNTNAQEKDSSNLEKELILREEVKQKKKLDEAIWSLNFGGESNVDFDTFGGNFGFRAYPFGNKKIGLGLTGNVNFGKDKKTDSYTDNLIDDLNVYGEISNRNISSVGLSGEVQIGPAFLGGGVSYKTWNEESIVELKEGNEKIKSNSDLKSNKKIAGRAYGGIEIPITRTCGLDAFTGYDWNTGTFFGIKTNIKLNK